MLSNLRRSVTVDAIAATVLISLAIDTLDYTTVWTDSCPDRKR